MKSIFISALCIICSMLLIPISVMGENGTTLKTDVKQETVEKNEPEIKGYSTFKLLDSASGAINEIAAQDYIFGVVAAEMPALYETEALKAQAVAAYTFACYRKNEAAESGREYDLSTDYKTDQSYITKSAALEKWGEKAAEYEQKITDVISAVTGKVITYQNKIILSSYHAISSGVTESCENVWGNALPYLVPVESLGDKLAETYLSSVTLTAEELNLGLSSVADASGEGNAFSGQKISESGTVLQIDVRGKTVTGFAVAEAFSLRSACFEVSFADGIYTFTVKGYGHGVGMSQNGANHMAKLGSSYEEILTHYYKDCRVTDSK